MAQHRPAESSRKGQPAATAPAVPHAPAMHSLTAWRRLAWSRIAVALLGGLLLAAAFPPLGWWPAALLAPLPLLVLPFPRRRLARLLVGFVFGYGYFGGSLHWLNTVGFGAGWALAAVCALFPAIWYLLCGTLAWHWKPAQGDDEDGRDGERKRLAVLPGASTAYLNPGRGLFLCTVFAAIWTSLEWVRGWIFTGFPWNQLGIAFANCPVLRQPAALGGVWLLSFLALLTAAFLADTATRMAIRREGRRGYGAALAALTLAAWWAGAAALRPAPELPAPAAREITILAIQGDIPECRVWDGDIYAEYFHRMATLTREAMAAATAAGEDVGYILWPESVLPAHLSWPRYSQDLQQLLSQVKKPLLCGALDARFDPERLQQQQMPDFFNCFILLEEKSPIFASPLADRGQCYDKCHLVPFGEYVPYSRIWPKLADLLGLGRDLTPGRRPVLFRLQDNQGYAHLAGVNICFEDAFPEISRRFTCLGAEFLMTATNDCWYRHSAGADQHLAHAVMRAVENHRPLLRSGNNSDTCLIQADGTVCEAINDGDFGPGWRLYRLPLPEPPRRQLTPYSRAGAWFPLACVLLAAAVFRAVGLDCLARRHALRAARTGG